MNKTTCALAIFFDIGETVKKLCKYTVYLHDVPTSIVDMGRSKFLISNVGEHSITCLNNVSSHNDSWSKQAVIKLAQNCTFESQGFFIETDVNTDSDIDCSKEFF